RNDGACGLVHSRPRLGWHSHGNQRAVDGTHFEPAAVKAPLVCQLAGRSDPRTGDWGLGDPTEGKDFPVDTAVWGRAEVCTESLSGNDCWWNPDNGSL